MSLNHEAGATINVTSPRPMPGGLSVTETFTINVTNVNETPTDIALDRQHGGGERRRRCHRHAVHCRSRRAAAPTPTRSSDGRFEVVGNTLKLKAGVSLDHESESTVSVDVTSTDAGGLSRTETFTINVTNVNEAPDRDHAVGNATVNENAAGAVIGT